MNPCRSTFSQILATGATLLALGHDGALAAVQHPMGSLEDPDILRT